MTMFPYSMYNSAFSFLYMNVVQDYQIEKGIPDLHGSGMLVTARAPVQVVTVCFQVISINRKGNKQEYSRYGSCKCGFSYDNDRIALDIQFTNAISNPKVKEVANIVEQTIQLSVTEVVLANDKNLREKAHERFSDRLQQVAEDIDRIWKKSTNIQYKGKHASKESTVHEFPSSSSNILNVENSMVGRDDQRKRLVEVLIRSYSGEPKSSRLSGWEA
ncbi:hypothetical protein P3S68_008944 [Capsicum galapagoense]